MSRSMLEYLYATAKAETDKAAAARADGRRVSVSHKRALRAFAEACSREGVTPEQVAAAYESTPDPRQKTSTS